MKLAAVPKSKKRAAAAPVADVEAEAAAPPAKRAKARRGAAAAASDAPSDAAAPPGGDAAAAGGGVAAKAPRKGRREWREGAGPPPADLFARPAGGGAWHEALAALPPLPPPPAAASSAGRHRATRPPPPAQLDGSGVATLRGFAATLLSRLEASPRGRSGGGGGDGAWLRAVRTGGTAADKVAAALVTASADPQAHGRSIDALLDLCGGARAAGGKRQAASAVDALRELFLGDGLMPTHRKLRAFEANDLVGLLRLQQSGGSGGKAGAAPPAAPAPAPAVPASLDALSPVQQQYLLHWGFEDVLKERHARLVTILASLSRDPLEHLKTKAVSTAAALLTSKPEGEAALLPIVVNKLGDPARRAASSAAHALSKVVAAHPAMKGVVVREVGRFAFRPGVGAKACYAAAVFCAGLPLSHRDADEAVAAQLVTFYVRLFERLLPGAAEAAAARGAAAGGGGGGDGEGGGDGGGAAAGAATAAAASAPAKRKPYARPGGKGKHAKGGKGKKKGFSGGSKKRLPPGGAAPPPQRDAAVDAAGLDSRLLRALLTGLNRALPYVGSGARAASLVDAVTPSLFRAAHSASLGVATQALTLLFAIISEHHGAVSDRFGRALYSLASRPELPTSSAAPMALSLLHRAMRADVSAPRRAAMVKRVLQARAFAWLALLLPPPLFPFIIPFYYGFPGCVLRGEEG